MTNYKRFISYLYSYEAGKKKGNVGYARVETSDELCKVTLHCTTKIVSAKECKVYLLKRSKSSTIGKQVGNASSHDGFLDMKLSFDQGFIEDADFNAKESQGIVLVYSKDNYIAAKWDGSSVTLHDVMMLEQGEDAYNYMSRVAKVQKTPEIIDEVSSKNQIEAAELASNEDKKAEPKQTMIMVDASNIINLGKISEIKEIKEKRWKETSEKITTDSGLEVNEADGNIQRDSAIAEIMEELKDLKETNKVVEANHIKDAGSSMEVGSSKDAVSSMEAGRSIGAGSSMEAGSSKDAVNSMEAGSSKDAVSSMETVRSIDAGSRKVAGTSIERENSEIAGTSIETGTSHVANNNNNARNHREASNARDSRYFRDPRNFRDPRAWQRASEVVRRPVMGRINEELNTQTKRNLEESTKGSNESPQIQKQEVIQESGVNKNVVKDGARKERTFNNAADYEMENVKEDAKEYVDENAKECIEENAKEIAREIARENVEENVEVNTVENTEGISPENSEGIVNEIKDDEVTNESNETIEDVIDDTELKQETVKAANCAVPNPNLWADHPSARAILNRFVRMYPFDDGEIAECVRLEPKDIGLLPMNAWVLGNNSFLLHSYCNFRHLLFAKKLTREGCVYLLMVPGAHNNREQQLAKMFGFENFKCSRRRSLRDGEFGYWYVTITFD